MRRDEDGVFLGASATSYDGLTSLLFLEAKGSEAKGASDLNVRWVKISSDCAEVVKCCSTSQRTAL